MNRTQKSYAPIDLHSSAPAWTSSPPSLTGAEAVRIASRLWRWAEGEDRIVEGDADVIRVIWLAATATVSRSENPYAPGMAWEGGAVQVREEG